MSWAADTRPGQVLKISKMVNDKGGELDLDIENGNTAWGIVLDGESMMVFAKVDQSNKYQGAPQMRTWVSRVYPIDWADEDSEWADADKVPDDVPPEFWPVAAQASLRGGV